MNTLFNLAPNTNTCNPITNLKWNEKDKIWMNHKLYTEKFEKIYPDLIPQDKINKKN